jgi:tetratricopeptide (TPR) repeat protein
MIGLLLGIALAGTPAPTAEAERLAAEALRLAPSQPAEAVAQAKKALALTADFEPLAYVKAGRKGEVVEDAYLEARAEYRRHRSRLYEAMGEALTRSGNPTAAARYLRRAVDLDPQGGAVPRLGRALSAQGRGREALDAMLAGRPAEPSAELLAAASEAADVAGIPSLQAEFDRVRIQSVAGQHQFRDGPLKWPERTRLSSGEALRFDATLSVVYVAEASCRSCSADVEMLTRTLPPDARVLLMADSDRDQGLRSVATSYRRAWPFVVGAGTAVSLGLPMPSVVLIARSGFSITVVPAPTAERLAPLLTALAKRDVAEIAPRASWNRVPALRPAPVPRPGLLASGFAPGEDEPVPAAFPPAAEAFAAKDYASALAAVERLAAADDGWLLGPEARLDRALCLAGLGRREEARQLLLKTGDSRFQEAVDEVLERVGTPRRR